MNFFFVTAAKDVWDEGEYFRNRVCCVGECEDCRHPRCYSEGMTLKWKLIEILIPNVFFVVTSVVFFFVQLTAVLAWRPHLHSQKWLSCSVQSLEMFSCVLSCEEDTALSIIDPTSALVELNNARRQKGRKNAGLLDFAEEQLPSLEVSSGKFFYSLQVGERRILQCDYSNRGIKIIQSQRFLKTKDSQVYLQMAQ